MIRLDEMGDGTILSPFVALAFDVIRIKTLPRAIAPTNEFKFGRGTCFFSPFLHVMQRS